MNKDIKIVELLNGEKLIGEVVDSGSISVTLKNIFVIAPQQQKGEQMSFAFVPWPIFREENDTQFEISRNSIVLLYNPNETILGNYTKTTSSLILPPAIRASTLLTE